MSRKQSFMVVWRVENHREHKHALKTMATAALNSANQLLAVTATVAVTHAWRLREAPGAYRVQSGSPWSLREQKATVSEMKAQKPPSNVETSPADLTRARPCLWTSLSRSSASSWLYPPMSPTRTLAAVSDPMAKSLLTGGVKGRGWNRGGGLSPGDPQGSQETQSSEEKWVDFFLCCPPTLSGLPAPPSPSLPEDMVSCFGASQSGDPEYGECSAPVMLYSRNRRDEISKMSGNIISSYKKKKSPLYRSVERQKPFADDGLNWGPEWK